MICQNCKKEINSDAKFCNHCGVENIIRNRQEETKTETRPEIKQNGKFSILDWILLLGTIIMLPWFIFTMFLASLASLGPTLIIIYLFLSICIVVIIRSRIVKYKKLNTVEKYKRFKKIIFVSVAVVLFVLLAMGSVVLTSYNKTMDKANQAKEKAISELNTASAWNCGDIVAYSGQNYKTVQIGSQCWFKENLNVGTRIAGVSNATNNGVIEKYCYDDNAANCATDGGLYQWDEAMAYSTIDGAQGICPSGWHIPKDSEWYELENKFAIEPCFSNRLNGFDCSPAGTELKSGGTSGFDIILAGQHFHYNDGSFNNRGSTTSFWSSTANLSDAWGRDAFGRWLYYAASVTRFTNNKTDAFSIRCLKD